MDQDRADFQLKRTGKPGDNKKYLVNGVVLNGEQLPNVSYAHVEYDAGEAVAVFIRIFATSVEETFDV